MFVQGGTDTFGRVKSVAGTPIVTKFVMAQMVPIFPLQSIYLAGFGQVKAEGIPLLAQSTSVEIHGIPLASVDATSVVMTYLRAICSVLVMFGTMMAVTSLVAQASPDEVGKTIVRVGFYSLGGGSLCGLASYLLPLTSRRERDIRRFCAELLGLAADPARVQAETSRQLAEYAKDRREIVGSPRVQWVLELIETRSKIAQSIDKENMEAKTDELLELLNRVERNVG